MEIGVRGKRTYRAQVSPNRARPAVPRERSAPKAKHRLPQTFAVGAGRVRDWPRGGRGTLRASPGGSGFSGSGEGAAAEAAPAAGGGAAAFCFPRLCWEVPAPRPERPASSTEWEEAGSSPRTPARGRGRTRGNGPGGARSPRSSRPSLNWPLWLIRSCCPSSGCSGSCAGELSGPGVAAKGAWPRGGGGTAGPGGLRCSLPAAGSMARDSRSQRR